MNKINIRRYILTIYLISFLSTYIILHGFNKLSIILILMSIIFIIFFSRSCNSIKCTKIFPISFNICGFLVPLFTSLINIFGTYVDLLGFSVLLLLSVVIASFHTFISTKYILVNVVRYCLTHIIISYTIFWSCEWFPYVLPFSSIIGIVLGSDIIPFIFLSISKKNSLRIAIEIGGGRETDAIVISSLVSYLSILLYRFLIWIT